MLKRATKRIKTANSFSKFAMSLVVVIVAGAGTYALVNSRAATVNLCPNVAAGACRPFDDLSAWNTPIPNYQTAVADPSSTTWINGLKALNKPLSSNPDIYTIPVYSATSSTPRVRVQLLGGYQNAYDKGDYTRVGGFEALIQNVPLDKTKVKIVPDDSDSQVSIWDPNTGDLWEFWQFRPAQHTDPNGVDPNTGESNYTADTSIEWVATNFTKYHTKTDSQGNRYYGRLAGGGGGRGAGTPYMAGLVRPWEISQGSIEHALAFAFGNPCCGSKSGMPATSQTFRYPATKSDGASSNTNNAPEGTRMQLDPNLTDAQLTAPPYNLNQAGLIIAHALQKYGMYVIDNSGSSKIYVESNITANNGQGWGNALTTNTLNGIPWDSFRFVSAPCDPTVSGCNPAPTNSTSGGSTSQGTLSLFVDPDGGSCTRTSAYDSAKACSWTSAYSATSSNEKIYVKGGNYGNVTMPANRAGITGVVFETVAGETPTFTDFTNGAGYAGGTSNTIGANNVTFKGPAVTKNFQSDLSTGVTVDGWDVNCGGCTSGVQALHAGDVTNFTFKNGKVHDTRSNGNAGGQAYVSGSNLVFENNDFYDAGYTSPYDGAHSECMYVAGLSGNPGITLKGNRFYHCVSEDLFFGGSEYVVNGIIENNVFEREWNTWPSPASIRDVQAVKFRDSTTGLTPDLGNLVIRNNTFRGAFNAGNQSGATPNVAVGPIVFENNVFLSSAPCGLNSSTTTFRYNAFRSGGCGTNSQTDANLLINAFVNGNDDPGPGDWHLKSTATALINKGNPASFTANDRDGVSRGSAPDIGAYEYTGTTTTPPPPPPPADVTPPTTTISSKPSNPTTNTSASFTFSANETSTFKCSLDNSVLAPCTDPAKYSSLAIGSHTFKVQATDSAGNVEANPPSYTWTVSPPADTTAPTLSLAPANGATGLTGTVTITATASDTSGIHHVDIYVDNNLVAQDTSAPYTTSWVTNTPTVANGSHTIKAIAYDNAATPNSTAVTNSVSVNNPDQTIPTPPQALRATATGPTSVYLSWGASSDNIAVTGYRVLRNGEVKATINSTVYTDTTAAASTTYNYTVIAIDAANNPSNPSNTATVTTPAPPDTTPPPAPANLNAAIDPNNPNQVNLTWSSVTDSSGIKGYNVYRGTTKLTSSPVNTTSFGDGTVSASTSYTYTVKAVDGANLESSASNIASITTPTPPPPATITTLSFTPTDDTFVNSRRSNNNYGKNTTLVSIVSPTKYSLYKFNVTGIGTKTVKSAKMRLYVNNGSSYGGAFHKISTNTWTESTTTWNNKPSWYGNNLSVLGKVSSGTWVEADLSSLVTSDGTYGILINSSSSNTVGYSSKETNAKPQLILGVQ